MRRVIVAGGTGFFGRAAVEMLWLRGIPAVAAARSGADLQLDVEDPASLRQVLRPRDVVLDTVGPFQDRSLALLEAAIEIGCDLIDISDSLAYARRVDALATGIAAAGIRVLPSCSSVSAISAWLVRQCEMAAPRRVSGFLAPSARYSASAATADSLLRSIGREVQVWRGGAWITCHGWIDMRRLSMPAPIGTLQGHLFETADSFWLPRLWPSLQAADYFVDTRIAGLNGLFSLAARQPLLRHAVQKLQAPGHRLARLMGPKASCLAVEVEAADGTLGRQALSCRDRGYRLALLPAVLAVQSLLADRIQHTGILAPGDQIGDAEMHDAVRTLDVEFVSSECRAGALPLPGHAQLE
jgi:hypothetical protein